MVLFLATRLSPGKNTFTFGGIVEGEKIFATGSLWVPDSLAF